MSGGEIKPPTGFAAFVRNVHNFITENEQIILTTLILIAVGYVLFKKVVKVEVVRKK
jgi:hypothetical protein